MENRQDFRRKERALSTQIMVTSALATLSRRPTVFLTFSRTARRWRPFGSRPNLVNSVQELSVRFRNVVQTSQNPSDHTLRHQVNTTVICNLMLLIVVTALSRRGLRRNPDSIAPEKRRLRRDGWELFHGYNRLPGRSWPPILRAKNSKKIAIAESTLGKRHPSQDWCTSSIPVCGATYGTPFLTHIATLESVSLCVRMRS